MAALRATVAGLIVGMMVLNYAAAAGQQPDSRDDSRGTPAHSSPKGPPLSPPVGPPLSPPMGPPLSPPIGPPLGTVDVCHVNARDQWQAISVSASGNAVSAHLAHGDALPGDGVPGTAGYAFDDDCVPVEISALAFTPVEWSITLDTHGAGIHTVFMIADVSPLAVDEVEDLGGRLVWEETEVELCGISIRGGGDGSLLIGDGFQTTECADAGLETAFDDFDLPETACLFVRTGGLEHEYCAPLTV